MVLQGVPHVMADYFWSTRWFRCGEFHWTVLDRPRPIGICFPTGSSLGIFPGQSKPVGGASSPILVIANADNRRNGRWHFVSYSGHVVAEDNALITRVR